MDKDEKEDDFYEELIVNCASSLGDSRTENLEDVKFQRRFVNVSPVKSKFKKTVETILCIHGWKSPNKKEPMTLIILSVSLNCHAEQFRCQAVRIWLGFREDGKSEVLNEDYATPYVAAYAPWVKQQRWDASTSNIEEKDDYGGAARIDNVTAVELDGERTDEVSYTRQHFNRGTADRLVQEKTGRIYSVEWYYEQNHSQRYGVQPHFHLAALVRRSHPGTSGPRKLSAVYDMRLQVNLMHDLDYGIHRAFRLRKPEDARIDFDPRQEPLAHGVGARILERIDQDRLGDLAEDDHLSNLLDPFSGNLLDLQPIEPPLPPDIKE